MNSIKICGMCIFLVSLLVVVGIPTALGQGPEDGFFELEGNIDNDGLYDVDWADLFDVVGDEIPTPKASLPEGIFSATFIRDFIPGSGLDTTTYTQGSKDNLNISGGGWSCTKSNNVGNKFDLLNAYAAAALVDGEAVLYFGGSRRGNNGSANIGFWLLQDPTVDCDSPGGGSSDFTGDHVDGDLFIVSEFSSGGVVSTINVYEWVGDTLVLRESGADCKDTLGEDVCGTVNTDTILPPWLVETKNQGESASPNLFENEFFEGRLNLTALGLESCFNRFLVNTRSSFSLGSTIHDFAIGEFEVCDLDVTKNCPKVLEVNEVDKTIKYEIDGTVTNSGLGTVFDVVVICDSGTPDDPSDDQEFVIGDLGAGETATYEGMLTVDFENNGPTISAVARGASVSGGDLTIESEPDNDICPIVIVDANIEVSKECNVIIVPDEDCEKVVVRVDFNGEVCNEPPANPDAFHVSLINVTVRDDSGTPDDLSDDQTVLSGVTLPPNECVAYTGSYFPKSIDGSNPTQATFTDTVVATGEVNLAEVDKDDFAEASCDLCPPSTP